MMKTSLAFVAVLAVAAVGCKKSGGGDADCTASVTKGIDQMAASRSGKDLRPEVKAKMDDFTSKMKGVVIQRCTEDKWPADVVKCFDTVASRPDMMKCQGMLPQDLQDKVRGQVRDLMLANGGGLGHMRHHGPGGSDDGSAAMGSGAPTGSDTAAGTAPATGSAAPVGSAATAGSAK
jgi:hypothetical protein